MTENEPTLQDIFNSLKNIELSISASSKSLLSTEETAAFLGITVKSLQDLTHRKLIPYYKPNGKMMYFDKRELIEWLHRNRQSPVYEKADKAHAGKKAPRGKYRQ